MLVANNLKIHTTVRPKQINSDPGRLGQRHCQAYGAIMCVGGGVKRPTSSQGHMETGLWQTDLRSWRSVEPVIRVKSGKFGHQVISDTHLQTVSIQMRRLLMSRLIRIFTVCLVNWFSIPIFELWNKQGRCPNLAVCLKIPDFTLVVYKASGLSTTP